MSYLSYGSEKEPLDQHILPMDYLISLCISFLHATPTAALVVNIHVFLFPGSLSRKSMIDPARKT